MLNLCGKSSIEWLIENLKKSKKADRVILCTTCLVEDDVLCNIAAKHEIDYFRGSSEDKLSRWLGACKKYEVDFFVNVDGDDLFFDYELADHVISQYNTSYPDFIDGQGYLFNDVYGMTHLALDTVCQKKETTTTEYVKPHFENATWFIEEVKDYNPKWAKREIRMTLDYKEDFDFFETIIKGLAGKEVTFDNVTKFIQDNPSVIDINWHMENKWKKNQDDQIAEETSA
jgi:spore coat polysaccharide biosynthesis protein SpsF